MSEVETITQSVGITASHLFKLGDQRSVPTSELSNCCKCHVNARLVLPKGFQEIKVNSETKFYGSQWSLVKKHYWDFLISCQNENKEKVKFLSNNLKISKTKKNNPTPKANKRSIYSLTPWVDLQATLLQQSLYYTHRIMPTCWCGVCAINLEFKSE